MPTARVVWQYCIKVEKQRAETEAEDVSAGSRSHYYSNLWKTSIM